MKNLSKNGFKIVEGVYSKQEVNDILAVIASSSIENSFGVREFLVDHPKIAKKIFTKNLLEIIKQISPNCDKAIKSIYFDKPPSANWIVNWHQDLTINLRKKKEIAGYKNWRVSGNRVSAQPNQAFLESIFTIRIHLDDCTKENGALRIIKQSHKQGIVEIKEWINSKNGPERTCEVKQGGILLMKPLTLHASNRTENNKHRRVIHIEFTNQELPAGLVWKEKVELAPFRPKTN